ncbi:unnamed protein product, partial [Mesorhabditis belari]|uniref:L-serine deaminase n=1 Tax=Mesorhabditis belari TaxID=2138241 RepID=A0AAF3J5A9_9BILA
MKPISKIVSPKPNTAESKRQSKRSFGENDTKARHNISKKEYQRNPQLKHAYLRASQRAAQIMNHQPVIQCVVKRQTTELKRFDVVKFHKFFLIKPVVYIMDEYEQITGNAAQILEEEETQEVGGNVIVQGKNLSESRLIALGKSLDEGGKYINGYDHKDVIAGAGTVGLEIIEQFPDVNAVVLPAGGGGLVAGVATAIKGLRPDVKIISVEADRCPSFKNALQVGHPIETSVLPTLADGLAVPVIGVNAFATAKDKVDDAIVVDEKAIGLAILRLVELEKIVIEGAGACGVGALLLGKLNQFKGKKVVTVLSGGNIDTTQLGRVMERGMAWDNRLVRFKVNVSDRPGGISELTNIIAENGASIKDIFLERSWSRSDVFTVRVKIVAETRDIDHPRELDYAVQKRYA